MSIVHRKALDLARGTHCLGQCLDVVGTVVTTAVDEERRRAGDPARVGAGSVLGNPRRVDVAAELVPEALDVELELLGVATKVDGFQGVLVLQQGVVHLPEVALGAGGLGRLGGYLGMRMHVGEREVTPDVTQVIAEGDQQLPDHTLGLTAVRALVVAVLEERDWRVGRAADMVACRVDVDGEIEILAEELGAGGDRRSV